MALPLRHLAFGAVALLPLAAATGADTQTTTVTISAEGSLGNLVSAPSATTTLTLNPSGGTFTTSGGTGARLSSGADVYTVTVQCNDRHDQCEEDDVNITISNIGGPSGRLGALTNFKAAMGTATLKSGTPGTAANPLSFSIGPVGDHDSSKTFFVGFDAPLLATGDTGAAASVFQVLAALAPKAASTGASSTVTANVFRPIAVANTAAMQFGGIAKPASGAGTVTLSNTGALTTTAGTIISSSPHGAAGFLVTGEGGQNFTLTVPSSFVMTSGTNSLTVTTSPSASGAQNLGSSIGSGGSLAFTVGGAFPITSATSSGAYTGSLVVTVAYD
jgi:hypothetical protein